MQNSELYRRGFVVPLNSDAEKALYNSNVDESTLVSFYEIPTQEVFDSLWQLGFFKKISLILNLSIDDYEETVVLNSQIASLKPILIEFGKLYTINSLEKDVIESLYKLCVIAFENNAPIFLIL